MSKIFWFDTETTGLDPKNNAIIQIAGIIEINGEVKEEFSFPVRPFHWKSIDDRALEVNKLTSEEILSYPRPADVKKDLDTMLDKYVDKYNKKDKFVPAGYNVNFDIGMLRQWFIDLGDKYYGSRFMWPSIDVAQTFAEEQVVKRGVVLNNYKLTTVCSYMHIYFEAHEALADITATRELYYQLKGGADE